MIDLSVKALASLEALEVVGFELFRLWRCLHPPNQSPATSYQVNLEELSGNGPEVPEFCDARNSK